MYLVGIKGHIGLASLLFFLGLSLLLPIQEAEAGMLMSKGLNNKRKIVIECNLGALMGSWFCR